MLFVFYKMMLLCFCGVYMFGVFVSALVVVSALMVLFMVFFSLWGGFCIRALKCRGWGLNLVVGGGVVVRAT
ncbi:hypothetical protein AAHH80_37550, partial [Burkholderia pseudomallei]